MATESPETVVQETTVTATPDTAPATPPAPQLENKPMWEDDKPEPVTDEAKPEEKPADAPVEKPVKERDYGKEMQRMAQRQAAAEQKLEKSLEDRLKASEERILKALESKLTTKTETPPADKPVESPAAALKEKLKSIRSQSLAEPEVLDLLEPLIEEMLKDSGKRFSQADVEQMTQKAVEAELLRREALTGEQKAKEAQSRREADARMTEFKQRFVEENPDRAAEYDDLVSKWQTTYAKRYKGLDLTPETAQAKSDEVWSEVVAEKSPAKKPPKNDPKDTIGATTVPSGGSATRATATQKKDIPLWMPD